MGPQSIKVEEKEMNMHVCFVRGPSQFQCWAEGADRDRKVRRRGMGPVNPPTPTHLSLTVNQIVFLSL